MSNIFGGDIYRKMQEAIEREAFGLTQGTESSPVTLTYASLEAVGSGGFGLLLASYPNPPQ